MERGADLPFVPVLLPRNRVLPDKGVRAVATFHRLGLSVKEVQREVVPASAETFTKVKTPVLRTR